MIYMPKSTLTTAKHRNIAWNAKQIGDWKTAYKHTNLALRVYPSFPKGSEMSELDVKNLKANKKFYLSMIRQKNK